MTSKDTILNKLRSNVRETYDMPDLSFQKLTFADPVAEFIKQTTTTAGAKLIEVAEGADLCAIIKQAYPEAKVISTHLPAITQEGLSNAYGRPVELRNPDTVVAAQDLDGTDVGIVEGGVACAENACVWIPQTMKERAVCFISEYLIIIVSKKNIVSNMHQAYAWLDSIQGKAEGNIPYGTFISGPSKTADIEQSLVYGAQAACGVTVILKN